RNDPDDPTTLSNDFIRVMHEDENGDFWIGTQGGGLELFDREAGTFEHFRADPSAPNSLSNDYVFVIHEDRAGIMWIGTMGGGLNAFDRSTREFTVYTEEDGLSDNSIYGMLEDDRERLWLSTNYGLSMFDPRTGAFKNYTEADGLQSNEFNGGAFFKSEEGELFFGGINGFNSFFPREIMDNTFVPPVVITSFTKLNQPVDFGVPLSEVRDIVLSYKDYVFSFQFSALDFTAPGKNRYAYMMEGLDSDWIYTGAEKRFATYTTLAPGDYTFRVKGSNNDGVWNEAGVSIHITITPPFWKKTWFRALAGVVIFGAALFFYFYRMRDVRIIAELKAAHNAQMSIMPHSDPVVDGFDISGVCIPAYEVGGDFYDYIWMDEQHRRFGVAVGDVSGKAMKAAMIAVMSSGMISSRASRMSSIEAMMNDLNLPIHSKTDPNMYTALLLAAFDLEEKEMVFVNAGFSDPILKSNGNVGLVKNAGSRIPLGLLEETTYTERKIKLYAGDLLVFYSDGIPDAT
ncbi:MAG TPA: SpoIIE family protein phosphatase, partial [Candidatus Krumholzibacterium sp.]|nr:SpoIIE family protein phosphatase [Candidatus Krumholzibacterium sp.]